MLKLAVVEDVQNAHDNVRNHMRQTKLQDVELVDSLSATVRFPYVFKSLIKSLAMFEGGLMLILDLGLELPMTIKGQLRDEYAIPEEIIDEQVDGVVVALEAIGNSQISPLLVVIATKYGRQDSIERFLSDYISSQQRAETVKLELSPNGFSLANDSRAGEIIDFTIGKFKYYFGDRFDNFFTHIESLSHDECQDTEAMAALSRLLEINFDHFQSWQAKKPILREALKSMGSRTGKPLCTVGAWLYALAAYRCVHPNGDWQRKFDVNDLQPELLYCKVLPDQSLKILRQSIQMFYEMCSRLFSPENADNASEPLQTVWMSKKQGLNFALNFPCYDVSGSLYERIQNLYSASSQGKALPHNRHKTSIAIWKFWLASALASQRVLDTEGMFSPIWRMNIVAENRSTRVFFYE